ncbi:magnesium transporter [Amorphus sp. 3PC139-8]|uniref:magnesium transporter n=1 Tax=Amorphus sp. 3PC139-8 TaxID=2735676 RepID=UPI00345CD30D
MVEAASVENAVVDNVRKIARTNFARLAEGLSCGAAVALLSADREAETIDAACVLDDAGRLRGIVTLRDCLAADPETPVASVMKNGAAVARPADTAEGSARRMVANGLDILPVVGSSGQVLSVVSCKAAQAYLIDELMEDADRFAGLVGETEDDYLTHSVWTDFRRRIPWVLGLAVAGLAAGYVVHVYEDALDALVILALYMPMVADTGGNVGTQAASLVTRALSVGTVGLADAGRIFWREGRVALMLAATLFAFAYLKVTFISNAADVPDGLTLQSIALAIAIALAVQVVTATLIGAILPLAAIAVRQDPAVVSGPALTTIVDLTGLILYFTITTTMLGIPIAHG